MASSLAVLNLSTSSQVHVPLWRPACPVLPWCSPPPWDHPGKRNCRDRGAGFKFTQTWTCANDYSLKVREKIHKLMNVKACHHRTGICRTWNLPELFPIVKKLSSQPQTWNTQFVKERLWKVRQNMNNWTQTRQRVLFSHLLGYTEDHTPASISWLQILSISLNRIGQ